jgi:multiple sugar transport system permease protein
MAPVQVRGMASGPGTIQAPAVAMPVARSRIRLSARRREALEGLMWIAPAFLYLLFFIAYPFVISIYLSLSTARVGSPEYHFAGLANYRRLFADPVFWQTVRNSFVFTFGSETLRLVIGLPLAFALNRAFKGKRLVQGLILIPFVIPIALSALAWKWMFDSLYSVINWMLMRAHLISYPWQWLGEPGLAMWSVIVLNVWRGFPFSAVILLAALTAVPPEVIEAAKIDAAGPLRRFHYVVVPMVRPILFVGLLYSVVFSFTDFSAVWLLTQGGPYNTTHVFGTYAYNVGINAGDLGMGAAITLFIFPFLAVIVILMLRFLRRD